jgi:hypothetical protein
MKFSIILGLALLPACAFAQKVEIGIGGGISTNTAASDNMPYKANINIINYAANAKVLYNGEGGLQIGLEFGSSRLAGKTTNSYYNFNTHVNIVGNDGKLLVYSRLTPFALIQLNYKLELSPKSYVYGGMAAGYAQAIDKHENNANEGYVTPDGGHGYVAGLQIGYTQYLSDRWGFDLQAAGRYYGFFYDAHIPTGPGGLDEERLKYGVGAVPVTLQIRYRFLQYGYHSPRKVREKNDHKSGRSKHVYW